MHPPRLMFMTNLKDANLRGINLVIFSDGNVSISSLVCAIFFTCTLCHDPTFSTSQCHDLDLLTKF